MWHPCLELARHAGRDRGAQEGTRDWGPAPQPAGDSAGQHIKQITLSSRRRHPCPSNDKMGSAPLEGLPLSGLDLVPGGRCAMMVLSASLFPRALEYFSSFSASVSCFLWRFTKEAGVFLYSPQQFFHSYQIKPVMIIANIC